MIFPIKTVYICGPISAGTREERDRNIEAGKAAGMRVWKMGAMPVVPHLNSLGVFEAGITAEAIYLGDLALLSKCDAMLTLRGWEKSFGCNLEMAWAKHHNIPIFEEPSNVSIQDSQETCPTWQDLNDWLHNTAKHFKDK